MRKLATNMPIVDKGGLRHVMATHIAPGGLAQNMRYLISYVDGHRRGKLRNPNTWTKS